MTPIADSLLSSRAIRWSLAAGGGITLAALLALGAWAWHSASEARAAQAMADALAVVEEAQRPGAPSDARDRAIAALEGMIAAHPGYSAVPQLAYRLGNLRYGAGQYASARGAYELALAKGATGTLRPLAALGIAYTWEAERDPARALAAFEAALAPLNPKDPLFEEALVDVARLQTLAGKRDGAIQSYQRLLKERPDTMRGDEVRTLLASLRAPAR